MSPQKMNKRIQTIIPYWMDNYFKDVENYFNLQSRSDVVKFFTSFGLICLAEKLYGYKIKENKKTLIEKILNGDWIKDKIPYKELLDIFIFESRKAIEFMVEKRNDVWLEKKK